MSDLIQQLRARREALGLTQAELAHLIGDDMEQSAISYYESGRNAISSRKLARVADALGCDVVLVPRAGAA